MSADLGEAQEASSRLSPMDDSHCQIRSGKAECIQISCYIGTCIGRCASDKVAADTMITCSKASGWADKLIEMVECHHLGSDGKDQNKVGGYYREYVTGTESYNDINIYRKNP